MPTSAYEKLEGKRAQKYIDRANAGRPDYTFNPERTALYLRDLPFAKGWKIAEMSDATTMPEMRAATLDDGKTCLPISYDSTFIVNFARTLALKLDTKTAPEYLRFWLEYTRLGTERMISIETIDDIPWREEPTPQARKALSKFIHTIDLCDQSDTGFTFKASVLFRDALFDCTLILTKTGDVQISERELLIDSLTVIDSLTGF